MKTKQSSQQCFINTAGVHHPRIADNMLTFRRGDRFLYAGQQTEMHQSSWRRHRTVVSHKGVVFGMDEKPSLGTYAVEWSTSQKLPMLCRKKQQKLRKPLSQAETGSHLSFSLYDGESILDDKRMQALFFCFQLVFKLNSIICWLRSCNSDWRSMSAFSVLIQIQGCAFSSFTANKWGRRRNSWIHRIFTYFRFVLDSKKLL